eukprot:Skav210661  [mRNA]  locus=scaffold697:30224:33223:+ [translate_table: standard]
MLLQALVMEHVLPPPPPTRPYLATPPPNRPLLQPPPDERQVQSAPPERSPVNDDNDPLLGKHSKLYQRRKEIECELRRQFSLPEEAVEVLSQLRASRRSSSYGCPPPVPKPRSGANLRATRLRLELCGEQCQPLLLLTSRYFGCCFMLFLAGGCWWLD